MATQKELAKRFVFGDTVDKVNSALYGVENNEPQRKSKSSGFLAMMIDTQIGHIQDREKQAQTAWARMNNISQDEVNASLASMEDTISKARYIQRGETEEQKAARKKRRRQRIVARMQKEIENA